MTPPRGPNGQFVSADGGEEQNDDQQADDNTEMTEDNEDLEQAVTRVEDDATDSLEEASEEIEEEEEEEEEVVSRVVYEDHDDWKMWETKVAKMLLMEYDIDQNVQFGADDEEDAFLLNDGTIVLTESAWSSGKWEAWTVELFSLLAEMTDIDTTDTTGLVRVIERLSTEGIGNSVSSISVA